MTTPLPRPHCTMSGFLMGSGNSPLHIGCMSALGEVVFLWAFDVGPCLILGLLYGPL